MVLAKYDSRGNFQWGQTNAASINSVPHKVAVDAHDNAYEPGMPVVFINLLIKMRSRLRFQKNGSSHIIASRHCLRADEARNPFKED